MTFTGLFGRVILAVALLLFLVLIHTLLLFRKLGLKGH